MTPFAHGLETGFVSAVVIQIVVRIARHLARDARRAPRAPTGVQSYDPETGVRWWEIP